MWGRAKASRAEMSLRSEPVGTFRKEEPTAPAKDLGQGRKAVLHANRAALVFLHVQRVVTGALTVCVGGHRRKHWEHGEKTLECRGVQLSEPCG